MIARAETPVMDLNRLVLEVLMPIIRGPDGPRRELVDQIKDTFGRLGFGVELTGEAPSVEAPPGSRVLLVRPVILVVIDHLRRSDQQPDSQPNAWASRQSLASRAEASLFNLLGRQQFLAIEDEFLAALPFIRQPC